VRVQSLADRCNSECVVLQSKAVTATSLSHVLLNASIVENEQSVCLNCAQNLAALAESSVYRTKHIDRSITVVMNANFERGIPSFPMTFCPR
jgi:hypothetical protein